MVRIKCAGIVCLAFSLLLTQLPSAAAQRPSQSSSLAVRNIPAPRGLVAVIKDVPKHDKLDLAASSNPYIGGLALQIHWSDIEPAEGKPDWSKLDALFARAQKHKKWVHLLIYPGFFSPKWALKGVKTDRFPLQYGPDHGEVGTLPMPWDSVYLNRWFAFLKLLSGRYGTYSAFRMVAAAGPTSVSDEATLPKATQQDLKQWENDGYTPTKYVTAWQQAFQAYAADFPNQYISLSVGKDADILDLPSPNTTGARFYTSTPVDPLGGSHTRPAIVNAAISLLGQRCVLQMSDVHAGPDASGSTSKEADEYIIGFIGQVITGFQMGGGMEGEVGSRKQGAVDNPPLALRKSIDLAMNQNKAGQHVNYVEIYQPDVVPAAMQEVLKYGASLFSSRP